MKIDQFLYENPVFRFSEMLAWKQSNASQAKTATYQALQYYVKHGRIIQIKRELYAVVPPNTTKDHVLVDPYLIASKACDESVLGFHTALELYGVAYSSFEQFYFMSQQQIKAFEFAGQHFKSVAFSNKLKHGKKHLLETELINRQGVDVRITSLERTFVDVLDRVELGGGWEEVMRSLEGVAVLKIDRVIDYCLLLKRAVLNAKVGFCLEQRQGVFAPSEVQLERLMSVKPVSPRYASKKTLEPFKLIKKWNILLPVSVVNRSWEEPTHDI